MKNDFNMEGMHIALLLPTQELDNRIIIPNLTHGSNIVVIQSGDENLEDCDALITQNRQLTLGIRTADCAAVCFGDGKTIGVAHVGWRGLCAGLIEKMLPHFDASSLNVYISPFIHAFEIKKDFCYDAIVEKFGDRFIEEQSGKLIFNFKEAIGSLLPSKTVYDTRDTMSDTSFPSNRRNGTKDRFITAVRFQI